MDDFHGVILVGEYLASNFGGMCGSTLMRILVGMWASTLMRILCGCFSWSDFGGDVGEHLNEKSLWVFFME